MQAYVLADWCATNNCHYDTLRRARHSFLTRCIGWRKENHTDHPISYLDTLIKIGSESIAARLCAGGGSCPRDLWRAWRTRDCRSARCPENWLGARAASGGGKKSGWGVSWATSELSTSTSTGGRLQPRTWGNGAGRRNKRVERFRAKWIAVEIARAGLRHAAVCPNVTGNTKERIVQSKRALAGSLAIGD